ncbi:hypothetical protein N44_00252 [Microcystis aeruginosa NIES-44]|uniref:Uncharacterized protein n=1 Tax=Microcystis aeruginosa NIES-44 TaxID=449439 RepID=A0A0A1VQU9_MICAE|nr:hypothetical protein N44_00252 [Microcystis aeruginosa NIES-44]
MFDLPGITAAESAVRMSILYKIERVFPPDRAGAGIKTIIRIIKPQP